MAASIAARGRQDNLTYFAFTATPKAKTLELFGDRVTGPDGAERLVPAHLYSMRQAIEEGFILDVLRGYTTYSTYYRLANGMSADDPELPKGQARAALARFVSLHPTNVAQKAEIVAEHVRAHVRGQIGGRAKAMVVTRSRLHAVRFYAALEKYLAEKRYDRGPQAIRALVAFSGVVVDPDDGSEHREAALNGFSEKQLPGRFASEDYQVLVVAEKYQTGFDQPLLQTMYVDKKLAGVKAVQTLSRLNRTHPGKDETFVLDFANSPEEIQAAFEPYYRTTVAEPTDPNVLFNLQGRIQTHPVLVDDEVRAGVDALLAGAGDGSARLHAALDPAVARFEALADDAQEDFRDALGAFVRAYGFLGQVLPWGDEGLERLYYYGKYLLTKLPAAGGGGSVDLSGSVVLTHLRQQMTAERQDVGLGETEPEPMPGLPGEGRGQQVEEPETRLSELIALLNDRFGAGLSEADRLWFEQQKVELETDEKVRDVARHNDRDNFAVWLRPLIENKIVQRHQDNGELFEAYFADPERKRLIDDFLVESLYEELGQAA